MENASSPEIPRVGFSMGEPGGVGPQLLLTFLEREGWQEAYIPVIFGHRKVIERWRSYLGLRSLRYHGIRHPAEVRPSHINLVECGEIGDFSLGRSSMEGGAFAREAFVRAVQAAHAGEVDLLVTLPVDKVTFYDAEKFPYRGHTEYLRERYAGFFPLMVMVSDILRVAILTEHIPLAEVASSLSGEKLYQSIQVLYAALQRDFAVPLPRIAVLGLNPHAGDGGLLGKEEQEILLPVLQRLQEEGMSVGGPFSPDGFFFSGQYRAVDAVLALYHDQGLIPFKLMAGWDGFQYTAGLPFIRTAPDHGVAYDKVGTEKVELGSLSSAVWEGLSILRRRRAYDQERRLSSKEVL
ncbi:MAG: 4-hydroxythreonine-4-phosphate dehydrogenase PdxA [Bacteroidia bacterium]|nr:4-hydroxythreonine-4-phosphate dehydrogenase PdxA [Bacteroidia bacterium]